MNNNIDKCPYCGSERDPCPGILGHDFVCLTAVTYHQWRGKECYKRSEKQLLSRVAKLEAALKRIEWRCPHISNGHGFNQLGDTESDRRKAELSDIGDIAREAITNS